MHPALEAEELETAALEALLGELDDASLLDRGLWDGRVVVRRNTAHALALKGNVPAERAAELGVACRDTDPVVRSHIIAAIAAMAVDPSVSVPAIVGALDDGHDLVEAAALQAVDGLLERSVPGADSLLLAATSSAGPVAAFGIMDALTRRGSGMIPALVDALAHPDGLVRKNARQVLRGLGSRAASALIAVLTDDARSDAASKLLVEMAALEPKHEDALRALTKDPAPLVASAARHLVAHADKLRARSLHARPRTIVIPGFYEDVLDDDTLKAKATDLDAVTLLVALRDSRPAGRANAASLVGLLAKGLGESLRPNDALTPSEKDAAPAVRAATARALARVGNPRAASALLRLAADEVDEVAVAGRDGLMAVAPKQARAIVESVGRDLSDRALVALIDALVAAGSKAAPSVADVLAYDKRAVARRIAARVLGAMKLDAAAQTPTLLAALSDVDDFVRQLAAWALGHVARQSPEVTAGLQQARKDSVGAVRKNAHRSLERLAGRMPAPVVRDERTMPIKGFGDEPLDSARVAKDIKKLDPGMLERWLFDGRPLVRRNAAVALGVLGEAAASSVTSLTIGLKDPIMTVRVEAARAIGAIAALPAQAVPALVSAFTDAPEDLDAAIIEAIDAFGSAAVEPLLGALSKRPEVVQSTVGRVASLRPKLLLGALVKVVDDRRDHSPVVLENALQLLTAMGDKAAKAEKTLIAALEDSDVMVRTKVIAALGRVAKPGGGVRDALQTIKIQDGRASVKDAVRDALRWLRARS